MNQSFCMTARNFIGMKIFSIFLFSFLLIFSCEKKEGVVNVDQENVELNEEMYSSGENDESKNSSHSSVDSETFLMLQNMKGYIHLNP